MANVATTKTDEYRLKRIRHRVLTMDDTQRAMYNKVVTWFQNLRQQGTHTVTRRQIIERFTWIADDIDVIVANLKSGNELVMTNKRGTYEI